MLELPVALICRPRLSPLTDKPNLTLSLRPKVLCVIPASLIAFCKALMISFSTVRVPVVRVGLEGS